MKRACLLLGAALLALLPGSPAWAADDQEVVRLVVDLLADKDKDLRAVGLEQVRSAAKGAEATRQFAAQLAKLSPEAQVGLLKALGDRGDAAARPAVVNLLAASEPAVRVAAIEALGALGQVDDLRLLIRLLSSDSKAERTAAHSSLVRLGGEGVTAAIIAEMKQVPPTTQVALIDILTTRRAPGAMPELLSAAVGPAAPVRMAAMAALGQLAGPEQLAGMVQGVLKAESGAEREAAEKSIVLVCGRIADAEKRADPLLAVRESLGAADRTLLLPTLGRVGGNGALALVEAAVADPDSQVREIGLRALCNWPQASIAPRLVELLQGEKNAEQRTMLLAALIRVAPLADQRSSAERLAALEKALSLCSRPEQRQAVIKRARAIRTVETLRFVVPYLDDPEYAEQACETIVELAHHRELREAHKAEFEKALDRVMETSHDATVVERADRYKHGKTWARPTVAQ